ncbi:Putrescine-binding periplasmic protein [Saezia sanguinis]|jgi:putrescine transport system substrate-binding protein|uniref:Putrescine-binding periplasmic protein n=1 Tax=Saezia sanguinis TaxID=1965230 RepID=A0A433SHP4_9BURK|nr:extracellular solute-binding protein [Saezia sanguinis]RUS68242.1 Putrescine-binding periplasmic protein [Saezia sanguinis]
MKMMTQRLSRVVTLMIGSVGLTCAMLATAPAQAEEEKVLNIYNWSDYIAPDTIANFERETGIRVRYDTFDSNETLHTKLVAGRTGYDIVVPGSHFAKLQIEAGLFLPLDPAKIPNLRNLDPAIQAQLATVDPGNKHLVDWMWGYTTVGINVDQVKAALGDMPMPENAWDLVFKPEYSGKLRSCGIAMLDTASEIIPIALRYVGKDPYSANAADYEAAATMLRTIRPNVSRFVGSGSDYIDQLATGSLCVVVGWSGDMMISAHKSQQSSKPQNIEVLLPAMGGLLFFDTMAIPKDAPHPENAMKWINYILDPKVQASLTNSVFYANPTSKVSLPHVNPEIAANKAVFPSDEAIANMIPPNAMSQATRRLVTRTFTNFKANR